MEDIIQKMNELFISYRQSFISQKVDGGYSKISRYPLNDGTLRKHLNGYETVGIFSGTYTTKFITFDVDTKENAELDTRHLINVLVDDFNFNRDDIHVSFSGKKGFHIDLYFTKNISNQLIKKFYLDVLDRAELTTEQAELRPTNGQGLKLPLGTHKVTKNVCWYIDKNTFKPIEDMNYILDIEPIPPDVIETEYANLEPVILEKSEIEEFHDLADTVKISTEEIEDCSGNINFVLENNHLRFPNTRNNMTLVLAMYLREQDFSKDKTISIIESIMINTKKNYPDLIESSITRIKSQTKHIVETTYKKGYKLKARAKDVRITRDEILDILSIKEWHLKQLYVIHLVQSKRYAEENGNYYMTYKTMTAMGSTNNRTNLIKYIKQLGDLGKVDVVARNVFDKERSIAEGRAICKPNVYKIKKIFKRDVDSILFEDKEKIDLVKILKECSELFQDIDLKLYLPKSQYYKVKNAI